MHQTDISRRREAVNAPFFRRTRLLALLLSLSAASSAVHAYEVEIVAEPALKDLLEKHLDFYVRSASKPKPPPPAPAPKITRPNSEARPSQPPPNTDQTAAPNDATKTNAETPATGSVTTDTASGSAASGESTAKESSTEQPKASETKESISKESTTKEATSKDSTSKEAASKEGTAPKAIDLKDTASETASKEFEISNEELNEIQFEFLLQSTPQQAKKLLETQGYFNADVRVDTVDTQHYRLVVDAGKPVVIKTLRIVLDGDINNDPKLTLWRQRLDGVWLLKPGKEFTQDLWTSSKSLIIKELHQNDYLLATLKDSRANINVAKNEAELIIDIDSGAPIKFGKLDVRGLQRYSPRLISNQAKFVPGEPYDLDLLVDLQNKLSQDFHFRSVVVSPDTSHITDQQVPIIVTVTEQLRQKLDLGLTFDTVERFGARIAYDNYDFWHRGYVASTLVDVTTRQQKISQGFALPRNSKGYVHSINFAYANTDIQNLKTRSETASIWRTKNFDNFEARLGLEYLREKNQGSNTDGIFYSAAFLSIGGLWRDIDNNLRPQNGLVTTFKYSTTMGSWANRGTFQRLNARGIYYWTSPNLIGTWVVRGEAGQIWTNVDLPLSLTFRAGGSNSVRGYDYASLGIEKNGSIYGGKAMAVGSLEYQYPVAQSFAWALFADTGYVGLNWQDRQFSNGFGSGVRWFSPIAPLSFDIAYGTASKKFHWYLSLAYNY